MKNYRVVERTFTNSGEKEFIIQKRGFIFRWMWFDYHINDDELTSFDNIDAAEYFVNIQNSPKYVDKVIYSRKEKLEKLLEK